MDYGIAVKKAEDFDLEENDKSFYELWKSNPLKHKNIKCKDGIISFYHDKTIRDIHNPYIYYVKVHKNLRRQGLFTTFIKQLLNDENINKITILGVGSYFMINCLNKFNCFVDHGGDYIWNKTVNDF